MGNLLGGKNNAILQSCSIKYICDVCSEKKTGYLKKAAFCDRLKNKFWKISIFEKKQDFHKCPFI